MTPFLIALMEILVNRRRLMGEFVATLWEQIGGWAAFAVMALAGLAPVNGWVIGRYWCAGDRLRARR